MDEHGPFMNELPFKMVVFHSYVSLPEGIYIMLSHASSRERKTPNPFDKHLSGVRDKGAESQRLPAVCTRDV